jgi:hypothetical protein
MGHGAWGGGYAILFVKYDRPSLCINTLSLYRLYAVLYTILYMVYACMLYGIQTLYYILCSLWLYSIPDYI